MNKIRAEIAMWLRFLYTAEEFMPPNGVFFGYESEEDIYYNYQTGYINTHNDPSHDGFETSIRKHIFKEANFTFKESILAWVFIRYRVVAILHELGHAHTLDNFSEIALSVDNLELTYLEYERESGYISEKDYRTAYRFIPSEREADLWASKMLKKHFKSILKFAIKYWAKL